MADFCFVVPIYKVPYDMLQNCIDSILRQTYHDIELVLVDDGSPDECGAVCDQNAEQDDRIRVVHKKNGGLSDARNAGTDVCTAPWITYVDGDDWVDADFVQSFLERIAASDRCADMYLYNGYRNYSKNQVVCTPYFSDGTRFEDYKERETLEKECCLVPTRNNGDQLFIGSGWAKVFRVAFIREKALRFPIIPYAEDSIYFLYSVEEASLVEYVAKPVYHYRDTEGGMVRGYRRDADQEHNIYCSELFRFAERYGKSQEFVDVLYLRVFIAMQRCLTQKYYHENAEAKGLTRWKACNAFMTSAPYKEVYSHLSFAKLNRNSKIKFLLFRAKQYGLINYLTHRYNNNRGKTAYQPSK